MKDWRINKTWQGEATVKELQLFPESQFYVGGLINVVSKYK